MKEKKLQLVTSDSTAMTSDERYELIAQIAKNLDCYYDSNSLDEAAISDKCYSELNFDKVS